MIRYLEHPRSGALEFDDMGPAWVQVRDAVGAGTLRPTDAIAAHVTERFDALIRYTCLRLGRRLGTEVTPALTRRDLTDPLARTQALVTQLTSTGALTGGIRIPDAVGVLFVTADLRAGQIICHIDVDAPRAGKPATRVNWLTRQLKQAPDTIRVEAFVLHGRGPGAAELLRRVRQDPTVLVTDSGRELRAFRIAQSSPAGSKRGTGRGAFIDSVLDAVDAFYEQVIQNVKPWMPAPPRLRSDDEVQSAAHVAPSLISTALSSQDGTEPAEGAPTDAAVDATSPGTGDPSSELSEAARSVSLPMTADTATTTGQTDPRAEAYLPLETHTDDMPDRQVLVSRDGIAAPVE